MDETEILKLMVKIGAAPMRVPPGIKMLVDEIEATKDARIASLEEQATMSAARIAELEALAREAETFFDELNGGE